MYTCSECSECSEYSEWQFRLTFLNVISQSVNDDYWKVCVRLILKERMVKSP